MSALDTMQGVLEKYVGPVAQKFTSFKLVQGLMTGMMSTMPVTLGVALLSILVACLSPRCPIFSTARGLPRSSTTCSW